MKKYCILVMTGTVRLSYASTNRVDTIGFINRTQHPIDVVFLNKHCVDNSIRGTKFTIPPIGTTKTGSVKTIKVMFQFDNIVSNSDYYICTNPPRWVTFTINTYNQNNQTISIGNLIYASSQMFDFKNKNHSSGMAIKYTACRPHAGCVVFSPSSH